MANRLDYEAQRDRAAAALLQMVGGGDDEQRATSGESSTPANPSQSIIEFFGGASGTGSAGVVVNPTTSLSLSTVFACVRNLAEDCAKLPFVTYERLEPRGKKRTSAHPMHRIMHQSPNPEMTPFEMRQAITGSAVLFGNGFGEIERLNNGLAGNVWPIEPWRVQTLRNSAKQLYYLVDGQTRINSDDMIHIRGFGMDGVLGMMISQHGKDSIGASIAAQRFAGAFFGNGTRVSGILKHPKVMSDVAYKHLQDSFAEKHTGASNAHKPAILEEGADWLPMSTQPNDAQMLETRQFAVEDVARWFRMSPHKIGHLIRATGWSTLEATNTDYIIDTLMAWFVRWEQECQRKLVQPSEREKIFGEVLVNGMLRGDSAARATFYEAMHGMGAYSVNDILEKENENPIEGGDEHFVSGTVMTLANAAKPPVPEPAPTAAKKPAAKKPAAGGRRSEPDGNAIVAAHRSALTDAAARAVRREVEVIRRKAKKPDAFADAIRNLYADHETYLRTAITPTVTALCGTLEALGIAMKHEAVVAVEGVAKLYTLATPAMFLRSMEGWTSETLADRVEAALSDFENTRSAFIVDRIIDEVIG